jgi:hypothetical protein
MTTEVNKALGVQTSDDIIDTIKKDAETADPKNNVLPSIKNQITSTKTKANMIPQKII